jgi:hypothetical protein
LCCCGWLSHLVHKTARLHIPHWSHKLWKQIKLPAR